MASSALAQKHTPTQMPSNVEENHAAEAAEWLAHFINPMDEANYDSLRLIGYEQIRNMDNHYAMKATSSAAWVEVAKSQEGRVSGRPTGIAFDPNGPMYLATTTGGLWKTTNNGQNWSSMSDTWKTLDVGGVAVDPENPQVVYAGTGIHLGDLGGSGDNGGVGVYKSVDGGLNWVLLDSTGTKNGLVTTQMEVNPADGALVYRATTAGVRMSFNAGQTWTSVAQLGTFTTLVIDPLNPAVIYAAGGSQIKKSTDSGFTWTALPTGYPTGPLMVLGMSRVSSDSIYLSTGNSGTLALSTDAGQTWKTMSNSSDYLGQQPYYANGMAVNPTNPSIVVAGGLDIYSSSHGGSNLSKITNWQADPASSDYAHADIHMLKYNPYTKVLFALTDGGVFYSANNGNSWSQNMNADLGTLLFVGGDMALDANTGKPSFFAAGAQDNGLNAFTVGQDQNWRSVRGGDGGTMFVSPADGQTTYGTYVNATLYRSQDRGTDWEGGSGADPNDPYNILGSAIGQEGAPFYIEYDVWDQDPNVVAVCGATNLFLSTDGGSGGPADFPRVTGPGTSITLAGRASTVHIAKADDSYMYLGTSANALYYSQDQGQTWTKSTNPTSFGGMPTGITTDPNDATHVYMTVGGLTSKHFWVSTDNGADWTAPATNLPTNLTYRRVAVDNNGIIYVGNDYGVLRSGDGGKTWYSVADGLPMTIVTSLRVHGNFLSATTYGRGMFYVDLSQLPPVPTSNGAVAVTTAPNSGLAIRAIYPSVVTSAAPRSMIDYTVANNDQMTLALYDVLGRQERMLVNQFATKGEHEVAADLSGLAPGQHYVVLVSGGVSVTKPITIE